MSSDGGVDEGRDEAESDVETTEGEWHAWLAAMVVVGGIALVAAPDRILPGLVVGLGPMFIVAGVVGWVVQWAYKRWR